MILFIRSWTNCLNINYIILSGGEKLCMYFSIYPVFYLWEINSLAFCENYYYLGFCKCKVLIVQFYLYHKWFSINSRWLLQNDPKSQQFSVICREEAPVFALCRPCALHWRGWKERNPSFFFFSLPDQLWRALPTR